MTPDESRPAMTVKETLLYHLDGESAFGIESLPLTAPAAAETQEADAQSAETQPAEAQPANARPADAPRAAAQPAEPAADPFEALRARALACTACPLHRSRRTVVFGEGDRQADLLFVGEAPGRDEDRTGRPFVGRAGALLDRMITAMKLERSQVFIANILKCRPPGNRTPVVDEIACCLPFLEEQIALIGPRVIVALGAPAARTLLRVEKGISALRGRDYEYPGNAAIRVIPTFHPAYLLRDVEQKKQEKLNAWHDLQRAMKLIGLTP